MVLTSCSSSTEVDTTAEQLTMQELESNVGYAWFPVEMGMYSPQSQYVSTINATFATDQKVILFVRPSCSCRGTQKLFPQIMKVLKEAGVPESNIEVWSCRAITDSHPYMSDISLSVLPTIVVTRNGVTTGRVTDADFNGSNADSLMANAIAL
jgi:hypothetical protein